MIECPKRGMHNRPKPTLPSFFFTALSSGPQRKDPHLSQSSLSQYRTEPTARIHLFCFVQKLQVEFFYLCIKKKKQKIPNTNQHPICGLQKLIFNCQEKQCCVSGKDDKTGMTVETITGSTVCELICSFLRQTLSREALLIKYLVTIYLHCAKAFDE